MRTGPSFEAVDAVVLAVTQETAGPVRELATAIRDIRELVQTGQYLDGFVKRLTSVSKTDARQSSRHEKPRLDQLRRIQEPGIDLDVHCGDASQGTCHLAIGGGGFGLCVLER